jgi:hypothetical protein
MGEIHANLDIMLHFLKQNKNQSNHYEAIFAQLGQLQSFRNLFKTFCSIIFSRQPRYELLNKS